MKMLYINGCPGRYVLIERSASGGVVYPVVREICRLSDVEASTLCHSKLINHLYGETIPKFGNQQPKDFLTLVGRIDNLRIRLVLPSIPKRPEVLTLTLPDWDELLPGMSEPQVRHLVARSQIGIDEQLRPIAVNDI